MIAGLAKLAKAPNAVAGYDPRRDAEGCHYDAKAARDAVNFFPLCLTHTKGFSGVFNLERWQRDIVATMFGWKRKDGTRRYREAFIAVPRKNGKTSMCAGLALYCLRCDGEKGPEVYCAASSRDQATLVFEPAAAMAQANPRMKEDVIVHESVKRIICHRNGGFLRAIPAEAAQSYGFNASAVIFDELHTQPNRDLYDVLKTSQGARKQPLFVTITTAGHDRHSICWEVWEYARKVRDGIVRDPHFLPCLHEIREDETWSDEDVWERVNPNLGVSISMDFLRGEYQRAKEIVAYENTFRNLYLNEWTEQSSRWFTMRKWDECQAAVEVEDGMECWGGLDLSTTTDITAMTLAFMIRGHAHLLCWFWIPAEQMLQREKRDRVPYRDWIKAGYVKSTAGESIDYGVVRADINELQKRYKIRQIGIDRWNATWITKQLAADGVEVVPFGQGFASMSAPSKEFERRLINREMRHGGNPVLQWMASNVVIETDAAGNIKPTKDPKLSRGRIDGIVSSIMAVGVAVANAKKPSIYVTRGIRTT